MSDREIAKLGREVVAAWWEDDAAELVVALRELINACAEEGRASGKHAEEAPR